MKHLTTKKVDDNTKKVDDNTNLYQSIEKTKLVISCYVPNIFYCLEEQVGHTALFGISKRLSVFVNQSSSFSKQQYDHAYSQLCKDIVKELKKLDIVIRPKEGVRDLLEFIIDNGIVSSGIIINKHIYRIIRSKPDILDCMRKLAEAGILTRYSYHPIKEAIKAEGKKPFANLRRTELFGLPGLPPSAYDNAINFYLKRTKEAYKTEEEKADTKIIKKKIMRKSEEQIIDTKPIPKVLNQEQIKMQIADTEKTISYLRSRKGRSDRDQIPKYEKRLSDYQKRLAAMEEG